MAVVRIATWNVNSVRARMPRIEAWIAENEPDVLCLQETMVADHRFPRQPFGALGYELETFGSGGHAGVAIASRVGIDDAVRGVPGAQPPFTEPRLLSATCGGIRVHNAYAPNGRKVGTRPHEVKLAWFALFGAWLEIDGLASQPTVVAADLNIAPTDRDVWEPARYRRRNLTSPRERAAFDDLLALGLVDCVRAHFGDDTVYSWWNRRGDFYASDRGWRLDHLLADPRTAAAVTRVTVDRAERGIDGSSDHAPLIMHLR